MKKLFAFIKGFFVGLILIGIGILISLILDILTKILFQHPSFTGVAIILIFGIFYGCMYAFYFEKDK